MCIGNGWTQLKPTSSFKPRFSGNLSARPTIVEMRGSSYFSSAGFRNQKAVQQRAHLHEKRTKDPFFLLLIKQRQSQIYGRRARVRFSAGWRAPLSWLKYLKRNPDQAAPTGTRISPRRILFWATHSVETESLSFLFERIWSSQRVKKITQADEKRWLISTSQKLFSKKGKSFSEKEQLFGSR